MIRAVMAEAELVGPPTEREAENLMAEADAEDRFPPEHAAHRLARVGQRGRIGRTVGKKNAVGIERENLGRGRRRRHHLHAKAARDQATQDVALDSVVERDDQRRVAQFLFRRPPITASRVPSLRHSQS